MKTRVISMQEVSDFVHSLPREATLFLLFGGDRIFCCDEGVAVEIKEDGKSVIAGIATIAPEGEMGSGEPTIVGVYIRSEYRRRGLAMALTEATIRRCQQRGFVRIRMDIVSAHFMGVLGKLSPKLRAVLDVHGCGPGMDLLTGY